MIKSTFGFLLIFLLFPCIISAQPFDIEKIVPDLMGQSIWRAEEVMGRPDFISQMPDFVVYRYTRWHRWYVVLYFRAYQGQWIVTDWYLSKRR